MFTELKKLFRKLVDYFCQVGKLLFTIISLTIENLSEEIKTLFGQMLLLSGKWPMADLFQTEHLFC